MKVANLLADLTTLNLASAEAAQALVAQRPGKTAGKGATDGSDSEPAGPDVARARTLLKLHQIFKQDFGSELNSNGVTKPSLVQGGSAKESLEEARASVKRAIPGLESLVLPPKLVQQVSEKQQQTSQQRSAEAIHAVGAQTKANTVTSPQAENDGSEEDELEAWS